jgi:hypothetical protein
MDRRILEILVDASSSQNLAVRANAAECLGWTRYPEEAKIVLLRLLSEVQLTSDDPSREDQNRKVVEGAKEGLRRIKTFHKI